MSKIAFLNQSMSLGGAEKMMAFVIRSVAPFYEEIYLIQFAEGKGDYDLPQNLKYISLGGDDSRQTAIGKLRQFISRIMHIRSILRDNQIDLVCSFGFYFTFMAVLSARRTQTKVLASERRSPEDDGFIWGKISKWSYTRCSRVVFQLQEASSYYNTIPTYKKCVIPNPYLSRESELNYEHQIVRKEVVMAAARMEKVKGFDIGLKAMSIVVKKHPEYKLVIYGKGDFNALFGELINDLGISENVSFKGHSNHILNDILESEIFLLPSRVEGIPNMLLEAMGVGLPCVATNCRPGGAKLLLGDNEYGLLVDNEDYIGVANAILALIEDPNLLIKISEKAKLVRERFSEEILSQKWVTCFNEALEE